jgi:TonB family protein
VGEVRLPESALRKRALKVVMPAFPKDVEIRGVTGVVVAQLEIDTSGEVSQVRVLQAPAPAVQQAVEEALKRWRFKPCSVGGSEVKVRGKLTFYYVIERGQAMVRNPDQMPRTN